MAELIIFDMQRFALHDGPGIRTTVFLKGCPLDCVWCHNPESKKAAPQLGFLEKKCTGCSRCVKVCEHQVHQITEEGKHLIDFAQCAACGNCVNTCYNHALKTFGTKTETQTIMNTVRRDMDFYLKSNGGLTVSGGEPMLQFAALKELLQEAKKENIHVCLDTCGQAPTERYAEIAEYVDLFLFDYKITDPKEHKQYTGVDNRLILKNLDYLCTHGSHLFLRCPIISGINDKESHYRAIARLSQKYEAIEQVNLMTYHDMAKGKTGQIGQTYALSNVKTIAGKKKKEIYEQVQSLGCLRLCEG